MSLLDQAIRDQITRELFAVLNIDKTGDDILTERLEDVVLKQSVVSKITALPSSTIYRKVAAGEFPAPIKLGEAASGWLLSEVVGWIAARRNERDRERAKKRRVQAGLSDASQA